MRLCGIGRRLGVSFNDMALFSQEDPFVAAISMVRCFRFRDRCVVPSRSIALAKPSTIGGAIRRLVTSSFCQMEQTPYDVGKVYSCGSRAPTTQPHSLVVNIVSRIAEVMAYIYENLFEGSR